ATNSKDQKVQTNMEFTVVDFKRSDFPGISGLYTHLSNTSPKVGEKFELKLGTNGKIYTDIFIVKGNEVELYDLIRIKKSHTISFPIKENHLGGFTVYVNYIEKNRVYRSQYQVEVPYSNKQLEVVY